MLHAAVCELRDEHKVVLREGELVSEVALVKFQPVAVETEDLRKFLLRALGLRLPHEETRAVRRGVIPELRERPGGESELVCAERLSIGKHSGLNNLLGGRTYWHIYLCRRLACMDWDAVGN